MRLDYQPVCVFVCARIINAGKRPRKFATPNDLKPKSCNETIALRLRAQGAGEFVAAVRPLASRQPQASISTGRLKREIKAGSMNVIESATWPCAIVSTDMPKA